MKKVTVVSKVFIILPIGHFIHMIHFSEYCFHINFCKTIQLNRISVMEQSNNQTIKQTEHVV